jgi:hypothetical protein
VLSCTRWETRSPLKTQTMNKKFKAMEENIFYSTMKEGNIEALNALINKGHVFWASENGPEYDGPLQSIIKGYHCNLNKRAEMLNLMLDNCSEEVLQANKDLLITFATPIVTDRLQLSVSKEAENMAQEIVHTALQSGTHRELIHLKHELIDDNSIATVIEVVTEDPDAVWDLLYNIYWNNESQSLGEKTFSGSSAYGDRPQGSHTYSYKVGASHTKIVATLHHGSYSRTKGSIPATWLEGIKRKFVHPFDAQWDMFPCP